MKPREILWELWLGDGREFQAAWWMFKKENRDEFGLSHGIDVKRGTQVPRHDFIG